ncbi:protein C12orf4 homolog [Aplysia californica]|uniref:Protein C12orf4 homolog n=1 Tax=Aplysia californica TaxID=6500 RepID=A0ABM0JYA2_APLCA|nr:protein C12orf4 homolog [Aplysia californica]XP_035827206.1 protein C12orf4 homolog [Aplysia californica]
MPHSVEKDFSYVFHTKSTKSTLKVAVTVPLRTSVKEFVARLVQAHNLPCFAVQDLEEKLEEFVNRENCSLQDKNAEDAIKKVKDGEINADDLVNQWLPAYTEELKLYSKPYEPSKDEKFAEVYHSLIHSPALETLLNLEHEYSLGVERLIKDRDRDLQHLQEKQRKEMDEALANVGTVYRDEDINLLAQRQFENSQTVESKWVSELSALHEQQKAEYREWVHRVHEDSQGNTTLPTYVQRLRSMSNALPDAEEEEREAPITRLEESFTIHLGAQMKTTHNLRLLCTDILELCRHKPHTVGGVVIPQPQRLQTAMSLYSHSLCGVVMLVDSRLNTYTGSKQKFALVCDSSTDFHFPSLERQLQVIEQQLPLAAEIKAQKRLMRGEEADQVSLNSSSSSGSASNEDKEKGGERRLHSGDFYLTKHSNLSEVHTVFHVVADDNLRTSDITSRHPVILAIRNIIKLSFRYDIHTLTVPLLLTHEMTEEMTISWCMKRAELMFKCVKGFMIEMATYSSQESRTIQFLVPSGLSEELFHQISNMIPTIFRLSNPLVVKSS